MNENTLIIDQFGLDVLEGLRSNPKKLFSKYFYDKTGDRLFQEIMKLDEYYLTRCEYEIFNSFQEEILNVFTEDGTYRFNLVELGAGDGYKTRVLLDYFLKRGADFQYCPVDISANSLRKLGISLKESYPTLKVGGINDEYISGLKKLHHEGVRNVVLFLGSNIGNFSRRQAVSFLKEIYDALHEGDLLFIGFDLKKDPQVILSAYNDKRGITKAFNLNLLRRINRELRGDFELARFNHFPVYDPVSGTAASYLISTRRQTVRILDAPFIFEKWEPIHMEISQKYSSADIENLATQSGFSLVHNFYDNKLYFVDSVWQKTSS